MATQLLESYDIRPMWVGGNPASADAVTQASKRDAAAQQLDARRAAAALSYAQLPIYGPQQPLVRKRHAPSYDAAYVNRAPLGVATASLVLPARALDARFADREQTVRAQALAMPPERVAAQTGVAAERVVNPLATPAPVAPTAVPLARTFAPVATPAAADARLGAQRVHTVLGSALVVPLPAASPAPGVTADGLIERPWRTDPYVSRFMHLDGGRRVNYNVQPRPGVGAAFQPNR